MFTSFKGGGLKMTIVKNVLVIVLPFLLVLAIAGICQQLQYISAATFEVAPKIIAPVIAGVIIFFYILFLIKICPVKQKSTMICCIFGAIASIVFPYLYWAIPIPISFPVANSEAGVASVIFVLAYIFCIISYGKRKTANI